MDFIPTVFISHGSPMLMLEPARAGPAWQALTRELPRPRAILAVSAHWNRSAPAVSAAARPETIHDFHGFPQPLYELDYPAPGVADLAADLAAQVAELVPGIHVDRQRGLDHGAWSPLRVMYPAACTSLRRPAAWRAAPTLRMRAGISPSLPQVCKHSS